MYGFGLDTIIFHGVQIRAVGSEHYILHTSRNPIVLINYVDGTPYHPIQRYAHEQGVVFDL